MVVGPEDQQRQISFFNFYLRPALFLPEDFLPVDIRAVDFLLVDLRAEDFLVADFLEVVFLPVVFLEDFLAAVFLLGFFAGTLAPDSLASLIAMAIACLRLFTFLPDLPLFSVPRLRSCIAFLTLLPAFFP